jgi:hypothetical protein
VEQGSGTGLPVPERVDLAAAAGSPGRAWIVAGVAAVITVVVASVVLTQVFGWRPYVGLPVLGSIYLVSWCRSRRMASSIGGLERQSAAGVLRVRARRSRSFDDTQLVAADGWVMLGDRGWPAASVALGREPNWWWRSHIELQTPTGPVGVSAVPVWDLGTYTSYIVDREVRPLLARVLEVQQQAGPSPAGWYPDPQDPAAWRWWDGTAWGAQAG